ncbi:uncharacterized protein LOC132141746 [Carassius carassius]|uniref:uncharacterized protein LOC132141746 n=1 Tax=Carassius carassius TaxID=217509 RepID=UPI0028696F75|nr:uncharacterized protein LOC132141746 [Carassius carassius]
MDSRSCNFTAAETNALLEGVRCHYGTLWNNSGKFSNGGEKSQALHGIQGVVGDGEPWIEEEEDNLPVPPEADPESPVVVATGSQRKGLKRPSSNKNDYKALLQKETEQAEAQFRLAEEQLTLTKLQQTKARVEIRLLKAKLRQSGVAMMISVRMAPHLPLIFFTMMLRVSMADWGVIYSHSHICALKNSSVIMSCSYTYPTGHQIEKVFWTKTNVKAKEEFTDLFEDPEYSQRLQYLGDKQQNCTIRLSHVTQKDQHMYYFRFITNIDKWLGKPGVNLTVTDLQVEAPERVTEGHNVSLTCKSGCTLTDRATFIWYRNSQPLTERRDRNNQLLLQSVRGEDAGRYSCALHGHSYISPAAQLTITCEYTVRNKGTIVPFIC